MRRPSSPEHRLDPPVPVTARIVWEDGGEEYVDTEAVGWSGQPVYAVLDTALRIVIRGQDIYANWPRPSAQDLPFGPDPRGAAGRNLQMSSTNG